MLGDKLYTFAKWAALVGLPAITALWLGLGQVWGFPYLEQIGATLAIVATFLGTLVGVSNKVYSGAQAKALGADIKAGGTDD